MGEEFISSKLKSNDFSSISKEYAEQLSCMRKAIQERQGGLLYDASQEETCIKFLLDASMDAEKAAKKFMSYQNWKADNMPLGYIPDHEVGSLLAENVIALQGQTKQGLPLLVAFGCRHRPSNHNPEIMKRFIIYVTEKTIASAPRSSRITVILDLNNVGLKNFAFKLFRIAFELQHKYYPGILAKVFMVNAPKIIVGAWNIISNVLTKAIKEKFVFLQSHEMKEVLLLEIDVDTLPKEFGGDAKIVLLQDVHLENWMQNEGV